MFKGVLPCADCAGIRTELRLYANPASGQPLHYESTQTYMGTRVGNRTVESTGRWTIFRGSATDREAIVYQLDFDRPGMEQNFLKVGEGELRLLDRHQQEIPLSVSHSLHRVAEESADAGSSDEGRQRPRD